MKKSDLDDTVGIHPTTAEEFTNLSVTKVIIINYFINKSLSIIGIWRRL